jgi:hypothetical protein
MAATVTLLQRIKLGNARMNVCTVTFDSSYATGGEAVTPEQMGLTVVDMVIATNSGGYAFEYDYANEKLKVFVGNNDGAADGPLVEAAAESDFDEVVARLIAIGR